MSSHSWFYNIKSPTIKKIKRDYQYFPVSRQQIYEKYIRFITRHKSKESFEEYVRMFAEIALNNKDLTKYSLEELVRLYILNNRKQRKIIKNSPYYSLSTSGLQNYSKQLLPRKHLAKSVRYGKFKKLMIESEKVPYHDVFRTNKECHYSGECLFSFVETISFCNRYTIELDTYQIEKLKEFWNKYPDGYIHFG